MFTASIGNWEYGVSIVLKANCMQKAIDEANSRLNEAEKFVPKGTTIYLLSVYEDGKPIWNYEEQFCRY